jgi:hypothetical protein
MSYNPLSTTSRALQDDKHRTRDEYPKGPHYAELGLVVLIIVFLMFGYICEKFRSKDD